jgi:hypothetical protein
MSFREQSRCDDFSKQVISLYLGQGVLEKFEQRLSRDDYISRERLLFTVPPVSIVC